MITHATGRRSSARLHLGENDRPVGPDVRAAGAAVLDELGKYPDPTRRDLCDALAAYWDISPDRFVVGNGSDELVLMCALAIGDPDLPGLTTAGTFPGYRTCLRTTRRGVIEVPIGPEGAIDLDALAEHAPTAGVIFICNPHNPSGRALTEAEFSRLVEIATTTGTPLVIDEAYVDFAPPGKAQVGHWLASDAPIVSLRTFSKARGLAALRIGYAMGRADLVAALRTAQQCVPFSVNAVALAGAVAALADTGYVTTVSQSNAGRRAWFNAQLDVRGRGHLASATNFVAVAVSDSAAVEQRLERDFDILTRDAGKFGFAGYLRVSLGSYDALSRLLDALDVIDPVSPSPLPSTFSPVGSSHAD